MIRPATLCDLQKLVEFGRKFHRNSPLCEVSTFDERSFTEQMVAWIEGDGPFTAGVFVAVTDKIVGMIAGMVYPAWFNKGQKTGQDLMWWVEPDERCFQIASKMFRELEDWAKSCGAAWFVMAATESMSPDRLEAWYKRRGYVLTERHYVRGF